MDSSVMVLSNTSGMRRSLSQGLVHYGMQRHDDFQSGARLEPS